MEPVTVSYLLNILMGVLMYFMKAANDSQKERVDKLEMAIKDINDKAFKKEDFRDFRDQLWVRLDRLETEFKQHLLEIKQP